MVSKLPLKRNIKILNKNNKELAEFFGILTGDGYIGKYKNNYIIEIAGNKIKDKEYMEKYVLDLIYYLFNIKPNLYYRKNQNTMYLRVQSKIIFEYLESKGFPKGVKGKIKTPNWIINNEELMKAFVKGLFDTDGCVSFKKKEGKLYPAMNISSKSDLLLREIKFFLIKKEISSYFATYKYDDERYKAPFNVYQIQINGYKNITSWFQQIGSNNKRNLNKFNEMINLRNNKKL